MGAIDQAFESLFFGSGSWLGILLFLAIMIGLLMKNQWTGALLLPISLFIGLQYVAEDMSWHALIMFFSSIFTLAYMMRKGR